MVMTGQLLTTPGVGRAASKVEELKNYYEFFVGAEEDALRLHSKIRSLLLKSLQLETSILKT